MKRKKYIIFLFMLLLAFALLTSYTAFFEHEVIFDTAVDILTLMLGALLFYEAAYIVFSFFKRKIPNILPMLAMVIVLRLFSMHCFWLPSVNYRDKEFICSLPSPNNGYIAKAYRDLGDATTDFSVLVRVYNSSTNKGKNIYWEYGCEEADMRWLDDKTLYINGMVLDVEKNAYDYRSN